jgi:hypothetical protein
MGVNSQHSLVVGRRRGRRAAIGKLTAVKVVWLPFHYSCDGSGRASAGSTVHAIEEALGYGVAGDQSSER